MLLLCASLLRCRFSCSQSSGRFRGASESPRRRSTAFSIHHQHRDLKLLLRQLVQVHGHAIVVDLHACAQSGNDASDTMQPAPPLCPRAQAMPAWSSSSRTTFEISALGGGHDAVGVPVGAHDLVAGACLRRRDVVAELHAITPQPEASQRRMIAFRV